MPGGSLPLASVSREGMQLKGVVLVAMVVYMFTITVLYMLNNKYNIGVVTMPEEAFMQALLNNRTLEKFNDKNKVKIKEIVANSSRDYEDGVIHNDDVMKKTFQGAQEDTQKPSTESQNKKGLLCNTAIMIITSPRYVDVRVPIAQSTYIPRLGCNQNYRFVGLIEDYAVPQSIGFPQCNDTYKSLCCKTMTGWLEMTRIFPDADWYYKIDDDTLIVPETIEENLKHFDPNEKLLLGFRIMIPFNGSIQGFVEWWHANKTDGRLIYCSGGGGYLISRALMRSMLADREQYNNTWPGVCQSAKGNEDVATGIMVRNHNGTVHNLGGVHMARWDWDGRVETAMKYPYVTALHLGRVTTNMTILDQQISRRLMYEKQQKLLEAKKGGGN